MVRADSGPSVAPHTEYVHARSRCPNCGASVPSDRERAGEGRCVNCRS